MLKRSVLFQNVPHFCFILPFIFFCLSCNHKSKFIQNIENERSKFSPEDKKQFDSLFNYYATLKLYKVLFVQKKVSEEYIPLLSDLGEAFLNVNTRGVYIPNSGNSEHDSFILCSAILDIRGGFLPEFESIVNKYVDKYGYKSGLISNGLYYPKLYVDQKDKDALDAMGSSKNDWSEHSQDGIKYLYPEFLFKDDFIAYLKENYSTSKCIPPPPPPAPPLPDIQILRKSIKYEEVVNGYYVYCTVKNNTPNLVKYIDLNATFYSKNNTVVATGLGNTTNIAAGAQRTITIPVLEVDNEARYDVELGNVLYQ